LPLHVIPQDIRRLAQQLGFQNGYEGTLLSVRFGLFPFLAPELMMNHPISVQLSYTRFRPDGRAFLEFSQPEEAVRAASTLNGAILSGRAVHAKLHSQTVDGADNGAEVASREKGQKPDLTVEKSLKGRSVILEGLPEDIRGEELLALLERHQFELESTPDCSRGVRRVALR
jgi:RNA recognition motif-containing protein